MKQPWEWEEEDIEALIRDEVQENLNLDYKQCASLDRRDSKRNIELSKDVSSFANSAGGTLIYGVAEKNNHYPEKIDSGYDPTEVTREWIDQVITSTIHPRIDGIRIKQIELKKNNPGRVIYVVYVPQGKVAHMAADKRYWKRFEYNAVMMEDYEVRDINRREETPDLHMAFNINGLSTAALVFDEDEDYSQPLPFNGSISNSSPEPASHAVIKIYIDTRVKISAHGGLDKTSGLFLRLGEELVSVDILQLNWGVPGKMPIWEGIRFCLFDSPMLINLPKEEGKYFIMCEIHSPRMSPRCQVNFLQSTNAAVTIVEGELIQGSAL